MRKVLTLLGAAVAMQLVGAGGTALGSPVGPQTCEAAPAAGTDLPVVVRASFWYFKDCYRSGQAELSFTYGFGEDVPVTGDWDGNGTRTIGIFRPDDGEWHLRTTNTGGDGEIVLRFVSAG